MFHADLKDLMMLQIEKRNGHDVKHEVLEIAVQNENDLRHLLTE